MGKEKEKEYEQYVLVNVSVQVRYWNKKENGGKRSKREKKVEEEKGETEVIVNI